MDRVLWIDLETTGTDENRDAVLEIGAVLTEGPELKEVSSFEAVVRPSNPETMKVRMMQTPKAVVWLMHQDNQLWGEVVKRGEGIEEAESRMVEWMDSLKLSGRVPLGGSGVSHFDRRFIRAKMSLLDARLTYWAYDVGAVRRFLRDFAGVKVKELGGDKPHRALADIRLHVEEARQFRDLLKGLAGVS